MICCEWWFCSMRGYWSALACTSLTAPCSAVGWWRSESSVGCHGNYARKMSCGHTQHVFLSLSLPLSVSLSLSSSLCLSLHLSLLFSVSLQECHLVHPLFVAVPNCSAIFFYFSVQFVREKSLNVHTSPSLFFTFSLLLLSCVSFLPSSCVIMSHLVHVAFSLSGACVHSA